ncbi:MAG: ribosome recycling factor [Lachnospiraceae bacterium]|nr:ribosome recycling factor [Lachnospiraceae bacterium]
MDDTVKMTEERMQKSLDNLLEEFSMIRAGRANPKLLDKVAVSYYGQETPIRNVANISVKEGRTIVIQPYDRTLLREISKAIQASNIGINPQDDGTVIRLTFPELTGERRKEISKDIRKMSEECKVAVRNIRRDAMDLVKKQEKNSEITEDDRKDLENKLQKSTDRFIKLVDEETEKKTKEIMTV